MSIKYKAQKKYMAENTVRHELRLNRRTDADILEAFDRLPNRSAFVKTAIREKLNRERRGE